MSPDLSSICIRPFASTEWEAIRDIRLRALKSDEDMFLPSYAEALGYHEEHWKRLAAQETSCIFGLYDGATLIGLTCIYRDKDDPSGRTANLAMSFIERPYRGKGLSRLLYDARLAWAKDNGVVRIRVSHREGNAASRAAILAYGFRHIGSGEETYAGTRDINHAYELILKDT